jgi:hypothetical protein
VVVPLLAACMHVKLDVPPPDAPAEERQRA